MIGGNYMNNTIGYGAVDEQPVIQEPVEMIIPPYKVYVRTDDYDCIIGVNSNEFIDDLTDWILIDQGYGDKYHHAQGNYFDKPIMDNRGIKRYKSYPIADAPSREIIVRYIKDGVEYVILERTQEEMDADYVPPVIKPTLDERVSTVESSVNSYEEAYLRGVENA